MSVTINGTDGVSKVAAGVVDATALAAGAVTQPKVASGVAVNGPLLYVHRATSTQLISQNTWTKVQFNSVDTDTASAWDAVNYRFNPKVAGYYFVTLSLDWAVGPSRSIVVVRKNGAANSAYSAQGIDSATSTFYSTAMSAMVYANGTTDYFEVWVYQNNANASEGISFNGNIGCESYMAMTLLRTA